VPFPFSIAATIIIIIGIVLKCFSRTLHLQTLLCSLIAIFELASWVTFLAVEYIVFTNFHQDGLKGVGCGIAGIAFLIVFNLVHLKFFYKYISSDNYFIPWVGKNLCINSLFVSISAVFNFKIYRILHSKLL
jgi:hypothetical protein